MKYFITGITGFAAPHLAKLLLNDGHEVHALIRGSNGREYDLLDVLDSSEIEEIRFHYGDLTDYQSLLRIFKNNKYDGVFHLAAQSHPPTSFIDPVNTINTNVTGSANLIDVIQNYQDHCIFQFTSTSEVYGNQCKDIGILSEDVPIKPSNPYGTSKAMVDLYVQERCKNGYIQGFITRAFSHTGPRRGKNFSISWDAYHLALIKTGKTDGKILPIGNLKTKRIVIDVVDCVRAYYELMKNFDSSMNGEAFNVCGSENDIKEMGYFTKKLIDISGIEGVVMKVDKRVYRPIDIQIQIGSTEKIRKVIGWIPQINIDITLKNLFNYWIKKLS